MQGANRLESSNSFENQLDFIIEQYIGKLNTITLGEVVSINKDSTVDVKPLLNKLNGDGEAVAPPIIYDVPYGAVRGGSAGIWVTPQKGDAVIIGFCQRNIENIKVTEKQSNPNSLRKFDISDAVVLMHWTKKPLKVFIKITDDGIEMVTPNLDVKVDGDANITAKKAIIAANVELGASGGKALVLSDATITLNADCKTEDGKKVSGTATVTKGITTKVTAT